jgi:formamidopyrimidine-DNA glycosylase
MISKKEVMPEGPEVFIKAERIRPKILGKKLLRIKKQKEVFEFNSTVTQVSTKGKKLWIELDNHTYIVCSFALEGDIDDHPGDATNHRVVAEFIFEDPSSLTFYLTDHMNIAKCVITSDLEELLPKGVDPIHELFGMREWLALCKENCTKQIARLLVDQNVIAGIGNIYRSEILYIAGIDPTARMRDIDAIKLEQLLVSIYRVLGAAAKEKYTLQVHGKKVDPDGNPVKKVRIAKGLYVWSSIIPSPKSPSSSRRGERKNASVYQLTTTTSSSSEDA